MNCRCYMVYWRHCHVTASEICSFVSLFVLRSARIFTLILGDHNDFVSCKKEKMKEKELNQIIFEQRNVRIRCYNEM